ncbi:unnamed protein product [Bursaphelenchus okinawaensis]|uniref:PAP-associated domain-containing protein n=1 Tax=Bursaphelenchus okinawaensis TaxID=465554 RepID=A0A811JTL4_9BILA|nr:unnamed protein product [Bursaphelenchus okinawaensis]CAG9082484.1 unnamed protein product [Bursaphelenchus okinawaensis]
MTGPRPYMNSDFTQYNAFNCNTSAFGMLVPEPEKPADTQIPSAPWMRRTAYEQSLTGLHDEIMDLSTWLQPTTEEQLMRQFSFIRAKAFLLTLYPNCLVDLYGSVATGIYLSDSDLDICVALRRGVQPDYQKIGNVFKQTGSYRDIDVRVKSAIPLVKLVDSFSNFPIDITCNVASNAAVEWVKRQIVIFPDLVRLVMVVKKMLAVYNLNEPFNGGLSSYALVILMAHYLNYNNHFLKKHKCLGLILIKFLGFYGEEFDYLNQAITFSADGTAVFTDKKSLQEKNEAFVGSSMLTIIDPMDASNDVGRGAHRMLVIKNTFLMLKRILLMSIQPKSVVHHGSAISLVVPMAPAEMAARKAVIRTSRNIMSSQHVEQPSGYPFMVNDSNGWVVPTLASHMGYQAPYAHSNRSGDSVYTTAGTPQMPNPMPSQYSLAEPMVSSSVASTTIPSNSMYDNINTFMPPITLRPSIGMPPRYMLLDGYVTAAPVTEQPRPQQNVSPEGENPSRTSDSSEDSAVEVDHPTANWERERLRNVTNVRPHGVNVTNISEGMRRMNMSDNGRGTGQNVRSKKQFYNN